MRISNLFFFLMTSSLLIHSGDVSILDLTGEALSALYNLGVTGTGDYKQEKLRIIREFTSDVSRAVHKGFDVNESDEQGSTALVYAAMYCRPEIVELLLKFGANANYTTKAGFTAMRVLGLGALGLDQWNGLYLSMSLADNEANFDKTVQLLVKAGSETFEKALQFLSGNLRVMKVSCTRCKCYRKTIGVKLSSGRESIKKLEDCSCNSDNNIVVTYHSLDSFLTC